MADRFPLIANPSTRKIEELTSSDNLDLTGNSIVGVSTISSSQLTVTTVTGTTASFSGNVSIGGTLTYEDVTNVDSVGIITARSGVDFSSLLREGVNITAGKLSDNLNIDLSNGMVKFPIFAFEYSSILPFSLTNRKHVDTIAFSVMGGFLIQLVPDFPKPGLRSFTSLQIWAVLTWISTTTVVCGSLSHRCEMGPLMVPQALRLCGNNFSLRRCL